MLGPSCAIRRLAMRTSNLQPSRGQGVVGDGTRDAVVNRAKDAGPTLMERLTFQGNAMHQTSLAGVVIHRKMPGRAIVPNRY